ncbi:hypothetical protein XENTR_v10018951 [Xenopus tropicalis]|nr:hypothetical protein XENTR_v10018951 [Xenopus tropicalis]
MTHHLLLRYQEILKAFTISIIMQNYYIPSRSVTSTTCPALQEPECTICMERIENIAHPDNCIHTFCYQCILKWAETSAVCPLCREPFLTVQKGATEDPCSAVGSVLSEEELSDDSPGCSYVTEEKTSTSSSSTESPSSVSSDEELSNPSDISDTESDFSPSDFLSHVGSQYRGGCSDALTTGTQHHPANISSGKRTKTTRHLANQFRENSNGEPCNAKRKHKDLYEELTPQTSLMSNSEEPLKQKTKWESCPVPSGQMTQVDHPLCERLGQKRKHKSNHNKKQDHTQANRKAPERSPPRRRPRSDDGDDSSDEPER